jgi:hypothetical protein
MSAAAAIQLSADNEDARGGGALRPFELRIHDRPFVHELGAAFVLPNEAVPLEVVGGDTRPHKIAAAAGELIAEGLNRWIWRAPTAAGLYPLTVTDSVGRHSTRVNAFVMVPASGAAGRRLNGYTIGQYPPRAVKNDVLYTPPEAFVEVTTENQGTALSPHFRLKDFLCKQAGSFPKYVVLREELIVKLEQLLRVVRMRGFDVDTLHLMSGYRTPSYNRAIGNVAYSMHLWGGAADVIADIDLNHDQRIDRRDAVMLAGLVDGLAHDGDSDVPRGGLGVYGATQAHGPFVHVDVRPATARWGD